MIPAELRFWRFWDEATNLARSLLVATGVAVGLLLVPVAAAVPIAGSAEQLSTQSDQMPSDLFWADCTKPIEWRIVEGNTAERRAWVVSSLEQIALHTGYSFVESPIGAPSADRTISIRFISVDEFPIADREVLGTAMVTSSHAKEIMKASVFVGIDSPTGGAATTTLHELTHAMGIPHSREPEAVMFASYNRQEPLFTDADLELFAELRKRSGCGQLASS